MQILITGRGIGLTDAIEAYVQKKMNPLDKFFAGIIRADIVLAKETRHHQKGLIFCAEGKLEVPGKDLFAKATATTLYEAIDLVRDRLEEELKKKKVKLKNLVKKRKVLGRKSKEYQEND